MGGQLTKEQSDLPFGYLSPKDLENEKIQNLLKSRNNVKNMKKLITNASNTEEDNNIMEDIEYCGFGIVKLSPNIGYLYITTHLQICCDNLKEIPSEIGNMKNLTSLDLSRNKLKYLPDSIGSNLIKLTALLIDSNKIEELPQEIGQLTNLITFDVRNNPITVFPAELGRLKYLRTLLVEGCPLKTEFVHEIDHSPPTLMELAARKIIKFNLLNNLEGSNNSIRISSNLENYLKNYKKCSYCGGPYFNHHVKRGKIIEKNDNSIPLEYKLCFPHWNNEQERINLLFCSIKDHDDNNFIKSNNSYSNNRPLSSTSTRSPSRVSKRNSSTSMILGKSIKLNSKLRKISNRLRLLYGATLLELEEEENLGIKVDLLCYYQKKSKILENFNAYHIGICSKCLKNDIYESLSSDLTIPEADLCEDLCKECRFGVCNKYDQPNSHNKWCQRCEYGICVDCFDVNDYYGYCEKCNSHGRIEVKRRGNTNKKTVEYGKKSIQDFIKKHDKTCPIEPSVESLEPIKVVIKETETNETFWNEIDYYKEKDCLYAHDIESYGVTLRPITKRPSIVMELGSLCDFVGKLGWRAKIENIRLIVKSLSKLHELNYIHGDLHSGNILVKKYLTNEINNNLHIDFYIINRDKLNVKQAIDSIFEAWENVNERTIVDCWNKVGILPSSNTTTISDALISLDENQINELQEILDDIVDNVRG
ncbi:11567_t:CDS:10 [Entrophospora sp. SA101]|nr:11567_t:CDS:10 [Entrophospora sp. SA101]